MCHVLNNVYRCVCVRVCVCVYIGCSRYRVCFVFIRVYTYSESRAVDLIRFLQTDKEQNFFHLEFTPPTKAWNQTHPLITALLRLDFRISFFQRSFALSTTEGKPKRSFGVTGIQNYPRYTNDKIEVQSMYLFPRSFSSTFFFPFLNKPEHVPRSIRNENIFPPFFFFFFFLFPPYSSTNGNVVKRESTSIYLSLLLRPLLFVSLFYLFFLFSLFFFFIIFFFFLDRAVLWTVTESMSVIPKMFPTSIHTI